MQKLLILPIFLSSLLMSSVAKAEWTEVREGLSGNYNYVDLESIKKQDRKVFFWRLNDRLKSKKNGILSSLYYMEAECERFGIATLLNQLRFAQHHNKRRFRYLKSTNYKGPMGSGKIRSINNKPPKDWRHPKPNSTMEFALEAVCNHKN